MSGIEILGVAASVIQIADLGARLSVKLFTFSRKIKSADKSIDSISQEIAATGAVLKQLGNELSKDENVELCSKEALATTKGLVDRCMDVFNDLNSSLDGHFSSNSIVAGWKQRLKFPFLEDQIQLLRANLERLKSSLLVMLNVLIFAAQARRALIETLIEEKNASAWKYEQAQKAIRWTSPNKPHEGANETRDPAPVAESTSTSGPLSPFGTMNAVVDTSTEPVKGMGQTNISDSKTSPLPFGLRVRLEEIRNHGMVISSLLAKVNSFNREISYDFRDKLHRGILGAHWKQWAPLRQVYGEEVLMNAFSEHPELVKFWISKMEEIVSPSLSRDKLEAAALKANEQRLGPSAIAGLQVHKRKRGGSVRTTRTANIVPGERKSGPADVVYIDYHASNKASIAYESTDDRNSISETTSDANFNPFEEADDKNVSKDSSARINIPILAADDAVGDKVDDWEYPIIIKSRRSDSDTLTEIEEVTRLGMESLKYFEDSSQHNDFDYYMGRYTQLSSSEFMIGNWRR
ncbi:hypothetical protein LTS17_010518 [Exophiala oligosperma]